MIHPIVFHNDNFVSIQEVRLSPGQAGLMCGWGLFTTLRVFQGEPFAFERHWRRLEKDAGRTRVPFPFDPTWVRSRLRELIQRNEAREGTARIYAIYNKIGFWQSEESFPVVDLLLYTAGLPALQDSARLTITEHGRHAASALAGVKVTSWLTNVWNLQGAQQAGFDEVIMLNERGEVAECTAANIFCVHEGRVLTPPLSSGCLEGVTRGVLLDSIGPGEGVRCEEAVLKPEDFYGAEEVFITSTNRNLLGVAEISVPRRQGHHFSQVPGPVTQRLEHAFRRYMIDYVAGAAVTSPAK